MVKSLNQNSLEIPDNIRKLIDSELDAGESIRWIGKPVRVMSMIRPSFWSFPVALLTLFAAVDSANDLIECNILENFEECGRFLVPTILFFPAGIMILLIPYFLMKARKNIFYIITNYRVITLHGGLNAEKGVEIASFYSEKLKSLHKKIAADGSGEIIFEVTDSSGNEEDDNGGFFGIENVNEVESMLKEIVANNGSK